MTKRLLAPLLLLALSGCTPLGPNDSMEATLDPGASTTALPDGTDTTIERVVDGDTVILEGIGRTRLIGVDTPESVDPDSPVECYGPEAAARTAELLPEGTPVRVVLDVEERDRFDRTLAYLYRLEDGLFVNEELVRGGWAEPLAIEPNTFHADEFTALADTAAGAGTGLWGSCR